MRERLYKSTSDRMLSGVSGGLGDYLDVDSTLVRIAWVIVTIMSAGLGLLAYIALAIIVPTRTDGPAPQQAAAEDDERAYVPAAGGARRSRGSMIGGLALIVIGVLFLLWNLGLVDWFDWGEFWPVILIVLGVLLVARAVARRGGDG